MTGQDLKKERKRKGLKQSDLAKEMGVTQRTIINWEQRKNLSPQIVKNLHTIFTFDTSNDEICEKLQEIYENNALQNQMIKKLINRLREKVK